MTLIATSLLSALAYATAAPALQLDASGRVQLTGASHLHVLYRSCCVLEGQTGSFVRVTRESGHAVSLGSG